MIESIRQLFTGQDNTTLDLGRVLWAKMAIAYIAATFYSLYNGHPFNPELWGIGAGTVLAAGGAGLALKSKTEPGK